MLRRVNSWTSEKYWKGDVIYHKLTEAPFCREHKSESFFFLLQEIYAGT